MRCATSFLDEQEDFAKLSLKDLLQLARGSGGVQDARVRARAIRTLLRHFLWYLEAQWDWRHSRRSTAKDYWYDVLEEVERFGASRSIRVCGATLQVTARLLPNGRPAQVEVPVLPAVTCASASTVAPGGASIRLEQYE